MTTGSGAVTARLQALDGRMASIHSVRFCARGFHAAAYEAHGLDRPASIEASVVQRQAEFFFGRLAARQALAAAGFPPVRVGIGPRREPDFGPGVRGSITHTRDLAAAVVMPAETCRGIGIDIEPVLEGHGLDSIEQMALDADERRLLAQQARLPYALACTLAFSAKESFYKAVSGAVGYIFEFSALHLVGIDFDGRRARFLVTQDLSREWRAGATCVIDFAVLPEGEMFTGFIW